MARLSAAGNALAPAPAANSAPATTSKSADASAKLPADISSAAPAPVRVRPPSLLLCVGIILSARVIGAFVAPIADCDEVFNYWEPMHHLLFGGGLQTWEYSPVYALRSYLYVVLHAAPLRYLLGVAQAAVLVLPDLAAHINSVEVLGVPTKVFLFYTLRLVLAVASTLAEVRFVTAATRALHRTLGLSARWAGTYLLFITAFAPGQFIAATAMLPQSFVLVCLQFAHAAWLEASTESADAAPGRLPLRGYAAVIWWSAAAALVGCWPFVLVVVLPMAVHTLFAHGVWPSARAAVASVGVLGGASLLVDRHFYGRWTLAVWNLFKYNADSKHGPELYGVEPASYYLKNLALNWNIVFVLGAAGPLLAALIAVFTPGKRAAALAYLRWVSGGALWAALMFSQPHKEERFLYPIYHLLALSAVYCVCEFTALLCGETRSTPVVTSDVPLVGGGGRTRPLSKADAYKKFDAYDEPSPHTEAGIVAAHAARPSCCGALARSVFLLAFVVLSTSRNMAQVVNYAAPLAVWGALAHSQTQRLLADPSSGLVGNTSVCVGKEWYRFPSSFFVPDARILFLRSEFTGQLPQRFPDADEVLGRPGTAIEQPHFNDENREQPERYVELEACDYIIDLDLLSQRETHYMRHPHFRVMFSESFLDAGMSPSWWTRAFFVPVLSAQRNMMRPYQMLERVQR